MSAETKSSIDKLFFILKKNRYFSVMDKNWSKHFAGVLYGPLGHNLKQNIAKEWWNLLLIKNSENIFGVSSMLQSLCQNAESSSNQLNSNTVYNNFESMNNLSFNTLLHFKEVSSLVDDQLPFGIAQSGNFRRKIEANNGLQILNSRLNNGTQNEEVEQTDLLLQFFCSPSSSMKWFHYWQQKRHIWWRKFSGMQSSFNFSEIQVKNETHQVNIEYTSSWGKMIAETIRNKGSEPLIEYFGKKKLAKDGPKMVTPHAIECTTCLDTAAIVYLLDAYREKTQQNNMRTVLRLHPSLAPYQVSIALKSDSEASVQLKELAKHLLNELRQGNHCVFPFFNSDLQLEQQFVKYDEMGIPYCIIIDENSLQSGILYLRNRDTTVKEQVHMATLSEKLKYRLK